MPISSSNILIVIKSRYYAHDTTSQFLRFGAYGNQRSHLRSRSPPPQKKIQNDNVIGIDKYFLWQLYAKIEKMLLNSFGGNGLQMQRAKFDLFKLEKWHLELFNQIYVSICDLCHPKEAQWQKR